MSSNTKLKYAAFLLVLIFSMASIKSSYCIGNNRIISCPEIEKRSLLSFKQSLQDPDNLLSSWDGGVNCCKWEGVSCNNNTGHVDELHLRSNHFYDEGLSGEIHPSLQNLKHLKYLDLSGNNFAETIPSFIGSFTNLEHLNLSKAGFYGKVPHNIGNLSNLRSSSFQGLKLEVDSLDWLSGLSQLEHLTMNSVNLTRATNWAQVINTLPSLLQLHFQDCSLGSGPPLDDDVVVNITSLTSLDLSNNGLHFFAIPKWISRLNNLRFLDLSANTFEGPIPATSNATKLEYINLSFNYFNSSIPDWLYLCKDLVFADMSYNLLGGTISNRIANLTSVNTLNLSWNRISGKLVREIANMCNLQFLYLSHNELRGEISDPFHNVSAGCLFQGTLQYLDLGGNFFSGAIPINLGKFSSSLAYLILESNEFIGNLPVSLSQLFNLKHLYINNNKLEGVVNESHFPVSLETFSASGNHLTLKVSPRWIPPVQLTTLRMGSWDLGVGSKIPSWLETQKSLFELDLSNTGMTGSVPSWFWEISILNLSHNHLHGKIPYLNGSGYVYLSSNKFSGLLPRIGDEVQELDLSNNSFSGGMSHFLCDTTYQTYALEILHLGGNQLSGELPDCWMKWPDLRFFSLENNNMSKGIPNTIGFLAFLMSLSLRGNKFSGNIPSSMRNCTNLVKMDLADNDLDGNIPTLMGKSLVKLKYLILRGNKLNGKISLEICRLNSLQILDLSDNRFSGVIPRCVYNFTAMATKRSFNEPHLYKYGSYRSDISYSFFMWGFMESASVATKGSEFHYDTILPLVTNIDLSKNNLSGNIPKELTRLVELRSLNLSGNHLTGSIPDKIGDMKQLESLDFSRNSLSGQIPNSFTAISSLNHLNLSYNKLSGKIPESTQLRSLDASSFIGNSLCGPPLTRSCSQDDDGVHEKKEESEDGKPEIEWFYVLLSLGYALGFSVVCATLVLNKSWREAYFGLLGSTWDKFYVYVCIKFNKLSAGDESR